MNIIEIFCYFLLLIWYVCNLFTCPYASIRKYIVENNLRLVIVLYPQRPCKTLVDENKLKLFNDIVVILKLYQQYYH